MTEEQIKHMVSRFLGWKLPRDSFNPDCGISFNKKPFNAHPDFPMLYEPSGTNLFDATQADAMVRYMLEGLKQDEFGWLIEAPGPRYLEAVKIGNNSFRWTSDHSAAIRFKSEAQADLTMMAVRELQPALFGFDATIGNAKAVEHGWIST